MIASFDKAKPVTLVYISAMNCPICIQWVRRYKAEFDASRESKALKFREVQE